MPWTLPLSDVAGVFMSPCASIHKRPIGSLVFLAHSGGRRHRARGEAVIAAEDERHRPSSSDMSAV